MFINKDIFVHHILRHTDIRSIYKLSSTCKVLNECITNSLNLDNTTLTSITDDVNRNRRILSIYGVKKPIKELNEFKLLTLLNMTFTKTIKEDFSLLHTNIKNIIIEANRKCNFIFTLDYLKLPSTLTSLTLDTHACSYTIINKLNLTSNLRVLRITDIFIYIIDRYHSIIDLIQSKCKFLECLKLEFISKSNIIDDGPVTIRGFQHLKELDIKWNHDIKIVNMNNLESLTIADSRNLIIGKLPKIKSITINNVSDCKLFNIPTLSKLSIINKLNISSNIPMNIKSLILKYLFDVKEYQYDSSIFNKIRNIKIIRSNYVSLYVYLLKYMNRIKDLSIEVLDRVVNDNYIIKNYKQLRRLKIVIKNCGEYDYEYKYERMKLILNNLFNLRTVTLLHTNKSDEYVTNYLHMKIRKIEIDDNCNKLKKIVTNLDMIK